MRHSDRLLRERGPGNSSSWIWAVLPSATESVKVSLWNPTENPAASRMPPELQRKAY